MLSDYNGSTPAVLSIAEANRLLCIGRSTGYALLREGRYPVRVVMIGSRRKVLRADLERFLLGEPPSGS